MAEQVDEPKLYAVFVTLHGLVGDATITTWLERIRRGRGKRRRSLEQAARAAAALADPTELDQARARRAQRGPR